MVSRTHPSYYINPAFSQQSEFANGQRPQRALSPQRSIRQSPVGAQTPICVTDNAVQEARETDVDGYEEQEFYEEIIVDDEGMVKDKKIVVISQNNYGKKYIQLPQNETQGSRYGSPQELNEHRYEEVKNNPKDRYEYIPMQEQDRSVYTPKKYQETVRVSPEKKQHRYAVIDAEEETELSTKSTRYALVPVEELQSFQSTPTRNRYEFIPDEYPQNRSYDNHLDKIPVPVHNTKLTRSQSQRQTRCEYIQSPQRLIQNQSPPRYTPPHQRPPLQQQRVGNPIATQKLHELLSTPRKPKVNKTPIQSPQVLSPYSPRKNIRLPPQSTLNDPFVVKKPSPQRSSRTCTPKAQKKLNYAIGTQQISQDKRYTAIVAPMCSSPIQSVYSDTTFSTKSSSWANLSIARKPAQRIVIVAAALLLLCGSVNCGLCFYMMSIMGKNYFLNFGVACGFMCLVLGATGIRSKRCCLLSGGNMSGYILLSLFSLSTCASLLILLFTQPKPGTPLADIMSGVVVGISLLSFIVAIYSLICGYCWKTPPRDNRVQHCSPGFSL